MVRQVTAVQEIPELGPERIFSDPLMKMEQDLRSSCYSNQSNADKALGKPWPVCRRIYNIN